jgi:hypothetical protein
MISFLRRLYLAFLNRHDAGLDKVRHRFGHKSVSDTYDHQKARQGYLKAQRQSATGRKYRKATTAKVTTTAKVMPIRRAK